MATDQKRNDIFVIRIQFRTTRVPTHKAVKQTTSFLGVPIFFYFAALPTKTTITFEIHGNISRILETKFIIRVKSGGLVYQAMISADSSASRPHVNICHC